MKKIIVYHDTQTLASRSRRIRPGETVSYRAIKDWDEKENAKFDEVINLSKAKPPAGKPETMNEKEPSHVKPNSK